MGYLHYIPTFVRVVDQKSFSGAARELGITKSAVSKHIQALEDDLKVRLLNRTTRSINLTEEGQVFYERSVQILEEIDNAERMVHSLNDSPSGVLKINAPESFGMYHLAPAIAAFAQKYPDIRVETEFSDRFIDIVGEGVDVCIRVASLTDSSLIAKKIAPCQHVVAASPDYIERKGTPKHPDELINHDFIEYSNSDRPGEWRYICGGDGKEKVVVVNPRLRANNAQMLRQAALAGLGIIAVPSFIIGNDVKKGKLVRMLEGCQPSPERGIYALFPHNRYMTTKLRFFLDFLSERFAEAYWEV